MDDLMSRVLITKYPHVFLSEPVVDVAVGHFSVAERAIEALQELHPGLRISAISRDAVGLMWIDVGYETSHYPEDIIDKVLKVVSDAKTWSAWTCQEDGFPGWRVEGPAGPVILCPYCQRKQGIEVVRHEA